jgi:2-C-methyl-D-erythritol 2,4-cyclodiphosphate synthase
MTVERRVGVGYDAHRFSPERSLVIGGVPIPNTPGLAGHSDADVLAHAVTDALLGASALGDIGRHFPDDDARYADADSVELLTETAARLDREGGWRVVNVDSTVICERPRLQPHVARMVERLCGALRTEAANVSVKATTSDGMGFTGRGEGIAAFAVALIERGSEGS